MIETIALPFGKQRTIRAAIIEGAIWFVASDLFKHFKRYTDRESLSSFRDEDLRLVQVITSDGVKNFTLVSVLGALTIATLLRLKEPRVLDAWVRRETKKLAIDNGLPSTIPMTLGSDGDFLVKPRETADHYFDWWDLKRATGTVVRSPIRANLAVLNDDDDNLMPEEERAELLARQERIKALCREGSIITSPTAALLRIDGGGK